MHQGIVNLGSTFISQRGVQNRADIRHQRRVQRAPINMFPQSE